MKLGKTRSASAVLLTALSALTSFAQSPSKPAHSTQTWITDVTIISPEKLDHSTTGTVVIEDGRILRIDRSNTSTASPRPTASTTVVSGKGQYLIPGLID